MLSCESLPSSLALEHGDGAASEGTLVALTLVSSNRAFAATDDARGVAATITMSRAMAGTARAFETLTTLHTRPKRTPPGYAPLEHRFPGAPAGPSRH
jgi:hypothetical protein